MSDITNLYRIRIREQLAPQWAEWFAPLTLINEPNGETTLMGPLCDQSALFGMFSKIRDLGLTLIAVERMSVYDE